MTPKQKMIDLEEKANAMGGYDIICGRDSAAYNNIGNRRFRVTISLHVQRYLDAPSRREKKKVIQTVFDILTKEARAQFLKRSAKNSRSFVVLSEREVRNKIQHALRDMAALKASDANSVNSKSGRNRTTKRVESPTSMASLVIEKPNPVISLDDRIPVADLSMPDEKAMHPMSIDHAAQSCAIMTNVDFPKDEEITHFSLGPQTVTDVFPSGTNDTIEIPDIDSILASLSGGGDDNDDDIGSSISSMHTVQDT
jgi:hypothetical protein